MAKTRSSKPAASAEPAAAVAESKAVHVLPAGTTNPPKLFVLPRAATPEAKVVTLPNPRYSKPTRYLACPKTGVYEFTKIAAPRTAPRTWLVETPTLAQDGESTQRNPQVDGQIVKTADLYVATPIDPLFLLIPTLAAPITKSDTRRLFVSSDDHFDKLPEDASHLNAVLCMEGIREIFEARMGCVCDTVMAGGETMFRVNDEKLLSEVLKKARHMAEGSLPASMEEKFVKKALEAPILSQRRQQMRPAEPAGTTPGAATPSTESSDSQASSSTTTTTATATSSESQALTAATSVSEGEAMNEDTVKAAIQASDEVQSLQRVKVAFDFICASYIPVEVSKLLAQMLKDGKASDVDFGPLDAYLAELTKLRAEAMAARSAGDYTKKRSRDEEEDQAREEKKRKVEEEKKKKAMESRGVRELKKVNTAGMRKLSDFFKKK